MNAAKYVLAGGLAAVGPDKPAVVKGGESVSYGDLAVRVSRFAAALREAGMKPGDRVAMLMLDHADLVSVYLAIIAAGGVAITVSTRATSDDLRHMLAIVRPFAVIAESDFAPAVTACMAPSVKLFLRQRHLRSWLQRSETDFVPCVRRPDDPAYWVMTSGTTGQPKAIEHRHDNVCACTNYFVRGLAATAADRFFPTSRLNFAYALGAMFGALRLGATLILHERWPTPPSIAATVELNRPSIVFSVPTLFHKLWESGFPSKFAFRAVRCYVSAGERLPPRIGVEWEKATGRPIIDAMSCSELVHKIFANTLSARRAGSSGRPVPGVEVRLIDQDGSEITQAAAAASSRCARLFSAPVIALLMHRHTRPRIGRASAFAAGGSPPATNIYATRMASITTAAAAMTCLRSQGFGSRRLRSKICWQAFPRLARPRPF
jgi:acyl-coenzyme A synthetase/AMP-(fatty) acid ligase